MEREPHHPEEGEQPHEPNESIEHQSDKGHIQPGMAEMASEDPQVAIEAARVEASRERRADRARLERYVELGLDPGDAEAVIEFEHMWRQQRSTETAEPIKADDEPGDELGISPGAGPADKAEITLGIKQPTETGQQPEAAVGITSEERRHERPQPRIYVRCLAAYNSGILHGCWINANQDAEALRDEAATMLNTSPVPGAEEYAIHDFEGFTGYPLSEHENLDFVSRLAQGIAEHGQAFAAYADWIGRDHEQLERFNDHHEGTYSTREAWAEEVADEIFEWPRYRKAIPEVLRPHVRLDLTDLALTLEQHRHVVEGNQGVYVFNPDA